MPETARDRMAYFIWCAKYDHLDLMRTGENHLLYPEEQLLSYQIEERKQFYEVADTMLEMLRSDVFTLVAGGKEGLNHTFGSWAEGIRDVLSILGWRVCGEYHEETGARCEVEITEGNPHGPKHVSSVFSSKHVVATWPVNDE